MSGRIRPNGARLRNAPELRIAALGSGSDYSPFIQHLGIASLNIEYGGESDGGSYHSIYDSFDHYMRFGDPNFDYGIAQAQTSGRAVLRLANADVLPFEFNGFADAIAKYVGEVTKLADDMREETKETNRLLREKVFDAVADPTKPYVAPQPKEDVPYLNFAPLQNALAKLQDSAKKFEAARKEMIVRGGELPLETQQKLDGMLMKMEQALTSSEGLPRRPWYQHMIYAPGFYTGYGVKTLPGVREAIEQRTWPEAAQQIELVSKTLEKFAGQMDKARELIQK